MIGDGNVQRADESLLSFTLRYWYCPLQWWWDCPSSTDGHNWINITLSKYSIADLFFGNLPEIGLWSIVCPIGVRSCVIVCFHLARCRMERREMAVSNNTFFISISHIAMVGQHCLPQQFATVSRDIGHLNRELWSPGTELWEKTFRQDTRWNYLL